MAHDDLEVLEALLGEVLAEIDGPLERARIARAVIALRGRGELDEKLAAAALIDLASRSGKLLGVSLAEAVAVRVGAARTPAGILLAA